MQTFKVYPKGDQAPLDLTCERFDIKDSLFVLYNSTDKESSEGFLSFNDIAAIVPDQEKPSYSSKPFLEFYVYLRDRKERLSIHASAFKVEDSRVVFLIQRPDSLGQAEAEYPLKDIYVALSEVIAITPADGLQTWHQ